MSVMVTGTGFIGSYVVRDLLTQGETVTLYGYFGGNGDPKNLAELPDLEFIRHLAGEDALDKLNVVVGDVTSAAQLDNAISRFGVRSIIHLASKMTSATANDPASAVRVNAEGTAAVFEAAARGDLDKVVYASSISVFSKRSILESGFISDDSLRDPEDVYGATKVLCEQLAKQCHARTGLPIYGLRISKVYGYGEHLKATRGGGSYWLMRLLRDAATGEKGVQVPFGERRMELHHVEDVSAAFLGALHAPGGNGESYLTHGDYRSVREIFDYSRLLLPDAELTLVDGPGGLAPGYSTAWQLPFDASRAEAELGIKSKVSMEEGILKTMNLNRADAGLQPLIAPQAALTLPRP